MTATSVPGLLALFQNEWDALMLETHTLKEHLAATRTVRKEGGREGGREGARAGSKHTLSYAKARTQPFPIFSPQQELANALYQHDAACRVIARLARERDTALSQLSALQSSFAQRAVAEAAEAAAAAAAGAMEVVSWKGGREGRRSGGWK